MIKDIVKKLLPARLLNAYYQFYPFLGALWYRFPSKKLVVIGVTGTSGKSTVVRLITSILEQAGYKTASASSISFQIGSKETVNMLKMTMPGRMRLQKFLRQAVNSGCQYAVLEVTSEGIVQQRHRFINFDTAIFTNLTPEHIESHGSFKKYRQAKQELFKAAKNVHVINIDDENARYFLQIPSQEKICFGLKNSSERYKTVKAAHIKASNKSTEFLVDLANGVKICLPLPGVFNIYNALAAICVGLSQQIDLEICKQGLENTKGIPGRMEQVISEPFRVVVDYAITPEALETVYQTINSLFFPQRLVCVLGACGGGRDKWKRPVLGKIADKYCQKIILTNEDPYDENPQEIINQIENGIRNISVNPVRNNEGSQGKISNGVNQRSHQRKSAVFKILDRREAIRKALGLAEAGDVVIITGKGSEPWMCVEGGKKILWDDRQVVKEEFKKIFIP
jgi:UDP-N-acetylmuramoyl-L-alanyl-D-glutamate--2,6-diaminopimelate ligase